MHREEEFRVLQDLTRAGCRFLGTSRDPDHTAPVRPMDPHTGSAPGRDLPAAGTGCDIGALSRVG